MYTFLTGAVASTNGSCPISSELRDARWFSWIVSAKVAQAIRKISAQVAAAAIGIATLTLAPAGASQSNTGYITDVWGTNNGAVLFNVTGTRTAPSACGANNPQRFAIDASTTAGQAAVAILLSTEARGKQIAVTGTGTCTIWGDTETVVDFWVQP